MTTLHGGMMTIGELPAGYSWRRPTMAYLERVHALMGVIEQTDEGEYGQTLDEMRAAWERQRFDLAEDAWLVEAVDGALAAYGDVWPRESYEVVMADGYVHPAHRGKGLGRGLVQQMEARAREVAEKAAAGKRVLLHNIVNHAIAPSRELLEAEGYTPGRYFWRMVIEMVAPLPETPMPEGVTVRTFRPEDDQAVHELIMDAFGDNEGHQFSPFEEWREFLIERESFNPELFFLAEADGELIAAALCPDYEHEGWIRQFGVRRDYRGRGVGHALLQHVFREQYKRGNKRVGLVVDSYNQTGAKAVYERAGMHVERQHDAYEKVLREGF